MKLTLKITLLGAFALLGSYQTQAQEYPKSYTNQENLLHPKTEIITGIMENECSELLTSFFKAKRN